MGTTEEAIDYTIFLRFPLDNIVLRPIILTVRYINPVGPYLHSLRSAQIHGHRMHGHTAMPAGICLKKRLYRSFTAFTVGMRFERKGSNS